MKNIFRSFISVNICILLTIVTNVSYAQEIAIECAPSPIDAIILEYVGHPGIQQSLITMGLQVNGESEYRTMWNDSSNPTNIQAECIASGRSKDMFPQEGFSSTNPPTLICDMNEGLRVVMRSPNNPDPRIYIYHAQLITSNHPIPLNDNGAEKKERKIRHVRYRNALLPNS